MIRRLFGVVYENLMGVQYGEIIVNTPLGTEAVEPAALMGLSSADTILEIFETTDIDSRFNKTCYSISYTYGNRETGGILFETTIRPVPETFRWFEKCISLLESKEVRVLSISRLGYVAGGAQVLGQDGMKEVGWVPKTAQYAMDNILTGRYETVEKAVRAIPPAPGVTEHARTKVMEYFKNNNHLYRTDGKTVNLTEAGIRVLAESRKKAENTNPKKEVKKELSKNQVGLLRMLAEKGELALTAIKSESKDYGVSNFMNSIVRFTIPTLIQLGHVAGEPDGYRLTEQGASVVVGGVIRDDDSKPIQWPKFIAGVVKANKNGEITLSDVDFWVNAELQKLGKPKQSYSFIIGHFFEADRSGLLK